MLILGPLGMYFDAAEVFVTSQTLLLTLAVAILCTLSWVLRGDDIEISRREIIWSLSL
jgi:hypothetical protein